MSKEKIILCDVDGVLADFTGALLEQCGTSLKASDVNNWDLFSMMEPHCRAKAFKILKGYDFWRNLPVLPHAKEAIEDLRRQGKVVFVTSPWANATSGWQCKGWGYARAHWLKEHFNATHADVIIAYSKGFVTGDILIDDRFKNIDEWSKMNPNGQAFLMRRPHNRDDAWEDCVRISDYGWEFYKEENEKKDILIKE